MSNYEDEDYEDDYGQTDLVKQLRQANRAKERELAELKQQLTQLSKAQRDRSVTEVLQSRGVNSKIAKFIPEDITDEAGISSWLAENGDLFGVTATEQAKPNISDEDAAAMKRISDTASAGITPEATTDIM